VSIELFYQSAVRIFRQRIRVLAGCTHGCRIWGSGAIDDAKVFDHNARYVFGDLGTFGWFVLALGVLQFFAAIAIWRGVTWGRWFGVACASANAILQVMWLPAYPILALTILPLDIVAIYGLLAYGGRRRAAREAEARAHAGS
jgi:uncharacterized membrane protein (DUF2068 family)